MHPSFEERYVNASDNTNIYYEQAGQGAPIVLCDGLACNGFIWRYLVKELVSRYRIIHWHYPGHGKSWVPPEIAAVTITRLAEDLCGVIEASSAAPAVIIGHSLGVQVALETWRRRSELVKALVLVCGVGGRLISSIDRRSPIGYLLSALALTERLTPTAGWRVFRKLPSKILVRLALLSQEINIRLIRRPDLDAYFDGIKSADIRVVLSLLRDAGHHDATPYLHGIRVPVLIIGGGLDRFTPATRLREMTELIPGAESMLAKRGSHALPVEQPDLVTLRIRRFLEERVFHQLNVPPVDPE